MLSSAISCRSSSCPSRLSLSSFLVVWSPSGGTRGPSVAFEAVDMPCPGPFNFSLTVHYIYGVCPLDVPDVGPSIFVCYVGTRDTSVAFEAVDMPCPGPFHFSHTVHYIYDFCPLPDPDVDISICVFDVERTSFHFGLCGRKFVLCLFGQCPCLCTIRHSWHHTGVVHLSLQADGKVAFEDIPVVSVCRPACHDSSSYLFVLVILLEAVVLSQVHVAWDIFYQHIVQVYRGVVYNHHLCLCDAHL